MTKLPNVVFWVRDATNVYSRHCVMLRSDTIFCGPGFSCPRCASYAFAMSMDDFKCTKCGAGWIKCDNPKPSWRDSWWAQLLAKFMDPFWQGYGK